MRALKNYTVIPIAEADKAVIEAWFRQMDADPNLRCRWCPGWRRGLYAWVCPACCNGCHHIGVTGIRRAGDGALHSCRRCLTCGLGTEHPGKGGTLSDVIIRNTLELCPVEPCARCSGIEGTQLHHWAPSAIFDDAERWPTSYLCRNCHALWHDAMRAASGWRLNIKATAERRGDTA